jgi:RimJ/RimL family protein N-acetyltransferase
MRRSAAALYPVYALETRLAALDLVRDRRRQSPKLRTTAAGYRSAMSSKPHQESADIDGGRTTLKDLIPLQGRRTRLVPPSPALWDRLYLLASTDEVQWPWLTRTPRDFEESLWRGVISQFAIAHHRTGEQAGLVRADNAHLLHGYAFVSIYLLPEFQMRGWPMEGLVLFVNFLFRKFGLQNLYAEVTEDYLTQYGSGIGTSFEVEACFKNRLLVNGERQNQYILTLDRERALANGAEMIERLSTAPQSGPASDRRVPEQPANNVNVVYGAKRN